MRVFILIVLGLICKGVLLAQNTVGNYTQSVIQLPPSKGIHTSFFVNEGNQVFLPSNGGICRPADSSWFIPPTEGYYFTSFAPNVKDTAFFAVANRLDSAEVFYIKSNGKLPIKRVSLLKLSKGVYHLIYKDKTCYIWGYADKKSKIGLITNTSVKWLLVMDDVITQVQISESSEIYFASGNAIYNFNKHQTVLVFGKKIFGFDFTKDQKIIVSSSEGIGVQEGSTLMLLAKDLYGLVEYENDCIFILPQKGKEMYAIYQK